MEIRKTIGFLQKFEKLNRQRKTLYKDGVSRFIFRYCLSCLKNKIDDFQNFLRKCKKKHEENIDETNEVWYKKRKMNEDDIEELIGGIKEGEN